MRPPNRNSGNRLGFEAARLTGSVEPHPPMVGEVPGMDELREAVRLADPEECVGSPRFQAAVFLLAALRIGQNTEKLTFYTGLPRAEVSRIARRLLDNGVWSGGGTRSLWRYPDRLGRPFWLDVDVATGALCRRETEDALEWAPAGHWHRWYDLDAPEDEHTSSLYVDRPVEAESSSALAGELAVGEENPEPPSGEMERGSAMEPPVADVESPDPESALDRRGPAPPRSGGGDDLFPGAAWLGDPVSSSGKPPRKTSVSRERIQ
jgi:hypothetical protein